MIARFLQDHFLGAVLVLSIMAIIVGIVGTYVSMFLLAVINLFTAAYNSGVIYG